MVTVEDSNEYDLWASPVVLEQWRELMSAAYAARTSGQFLATVRLLRGRA